MQGSTAALLTRYDQWPQNLPLFPRNRILLGGSGLAMNNVPDMGSDSRFGDCPLAVHDDLSSGGVDWNSECRWENHIKGESLSTGSRNGVT